MFFTINFTGTNVVFILFICVKDVNGNSLPLLLVLGYTHGIQENKHIRL